MTEDDLIQIESLTRLVDVDPHESAFTIEIENDSIGDFAGVHARAISEVDVERVCLWIILKLHDFHPRSGNA